MNTALPEFAPALLWALAPVALLVLALIAWSVADLARRPETQHLPKAVWALLVILVVPFGAVLYLVLGRGRRAALRDEHLVGIRGAGSPNPMAAPAAARPPTASPSAPTAAPALRVESVSRVFASGAGIHDLSFTAPDRSVTAVIGPNGAGKTVLFSIIAGLVPADSGGVLTDAGARIAYCPDVPQFEPWLTAREVVAASRALSGVRGDIGAAEALETCGLGRVADRRVADFSRGMLQRLGIAAALVLDPAILILDEPNSALDPIGRADIRRVIEEQRTQRCILLSSHLLSEVEQLADRVLVIAAGKLIAAGTTAELLTSGRTAAWHIRLARRAECDPDRLRRDFPTARIDFPSDTVCAVAFPSFAAAEHELPRLIMSLGSPVLEVTLQNRDLDSAFAHLVSRAEAAA